MDAFRHALNTYWGRGPERAFLLTDYLRPSYAMRERIPITRYLRWSILPIVAVAWWIPGHARAQNPAKEDAAVTIEYIAHACFRVTSPSGKQLLIDPYASRVWIGYDFPPDIHADAILISHPHYDHDGGEAMRRT